MLPYLCGSTMPVYHPDARGAFWGMTLAHGLGHFTRAILEAVAFTSFTGFFAAFHRRMKSLDARDGAALSARKPE